MPSDQDQRHVNRRNFIKSGVVASATLLLPKVLKAQESDLVRKWDEKYGRVKIYLNVPVKFGNKVIEWYVPYIYTYQRITIDGFFRLVFRATNQVFKNDFMSALKSVPPETWDPFVDEKEARDSGGRNAKDFARETARLTVPGPRDYPCQIDDQCAGIVINALRDENGNKFKFGSTEYESYPQYEKTNRQSEILPLTPRELLIREYRMKCDIIRRVLPTVRAYANKHNLAYCAFAMGLNPFDPNRYDRSVRMLGYILMQDKKDGVFRVVNQDIPKIAINLDGSPVLDALGNQKDIPGYKDALFFDQEFVKRIVALQKEKEEEQARAMVVVPYKEFVITDPNPNHLTIKAVTPTKYKDPTTGKLITSFETSTQLTEAHKKRLKNIVKPAVVSLDRPFIPYVPLDLSLQWYWDATPKTGDSGKKQGKLESDAVKKDETTKTSPAEPERGKLRWGK
jgi:hypothetical protein